MDKSVKRDASIFLGVFLLLALVSGQLYGVLVSMVCGLFLLCLLPRKSSKEKHREVPPQYTGGNGAGQQITDVEPYRPTKYPRGRPFDGNKPVSVVNVPDYIRNIQASFHGQNCKDKNHKEFIVWFGEKIGVPLRDKNLFIKKALWEYRRKAGNWMYDPKVRLSKEDIFSKATNRFIRWTKSH